MANQKKDNKTTASDKENYTTKTPTERAIEKYQDMYDRGEELPTYVKVGKYTDRVYIGGGNKRQSGGEITTIMVSRNTKERLMRDVPYEFARTVESALITVLEYWETKHEEEHQAELEMIKAEARRELLKELKLKGQKAQNK